MTDSEIQKVRERVGVPYIVTIQDKFRFYMMEIPGRDFEKRPIRKYGDQEIPNTKKIYFHFEDMSMLDPVETSELKNIIREGGYQSYHKNPVTDPVALAEFALLNRGIDRKNQVIAHFYKLIEQIEMTDDLDWINEIYSKILEVIDE
jgi:hypothetical protein